MKKLTLLFAIVALSATVKAQTTILKQEVDTAVINTLFKCYAYDPITMTNSGAKTEKAKKEFVNDMVIDFLKHRTKECAGGRAAEKARKIAEDEIIVKPIQKVE